MGNARVAQAYTETLAKGTGQARVAQYYLETLTKGAGNARVAQYYTETISYAVATARLAQLYTETITIVEAGTDIDENVESSLFPLQTIALSKTLNLDIESTISFSQLARNFGPQFVSSTLVLSQSFGLSTISNEGVSQSLTLSQNIDVSYIRNIGVQSSLALSQTITKGRTYPFSISQTIPIHGQLILRDDQRDSLTFNQVILAGARRSFSASNNLELTQSIEVHADFNRTVGHTIVFGNSRLIDNGFGGYIDVPSIIPSVPRRQVVLQTRSPNTVIVLPTPVFGDGEQGLSKINIKRAMDGARRITLRRSPTRKLSYSFVIDRLKAIELRSFIINNNSKSMNLTNWKGEIWEVKFVNNPFSLAEDAFWEGSYGNKSTVTLEFEGVKIT